MDTYTARTPTDLLALVPIVIGFHPEDSVVLLTFGATRVEDGTTRITASGGESFQARVDLPVAEHQQRAVAAMLRGVVEQHQVRTAALVFYSDDAAAVDSFTGLLLPGLLADGVEVIDVLRSDGESYYAVPEADEPGTPYELGSHALTATGVLHGRVVHPSRSALEDTLVGTDDALAVAVALAADEFTDSLLDAGSRGDSLTDVFGDEGRWLQEFLPRVAADRVRLSPDEVARVLVLLAFDTLREVAWTDLRRSNAEIYVEVLRGLLRAAPRELRAGVASLLGLAAWLAGDGALAWCALDRCLEVDPDDRLAQHVSALLESATPPSVWAPLPASALPILTLEPPLASSP